MKSVHVRLIILTALPSLLAVPFVPAGMQPTHKGARQSKREPLSRVLFSIPVGGEGIHYKGVGLKEVETWGPASFRIAPDGTFLITDTVTNRVLLFNREGNMLAALGISEADGITDAVKNKDDVYVLDSAAPDPFIIRLDKNGRETKRFPVRSEPRPRSGGLSTGEGAALSELYGAATVLEADDRPARPRSARSRNYSVTIPVQPVGSDGPSEGSVQLDKRSVVTVRVKHALAGLSVLALNSNGDFYVLVEELTNTPDIVLDQTVRHYRADGTLLESARVPVAQRFTDVSHGVAVSLSGQVYALITRRSRADVVQLEFSPSLPEILPARPAMALSHAPSVRRARCKRRRAEIRAAAHAYVSNETFLSSARLNGRCNNRHKPTYLNRGPRRYPSVPYDWGGFDTVLSYNNFMRGADQKYKAGDRKVNGEARTSATNCSRGVDCSGFVSRCWGLKTKEGTETLSLISDEIKYSDLQAGDILNKPGTHVVIFDRRGRSPNGGTKDGVYVWEATQYKNYDRVIHHWCPWSRFVGYKPRRYRYICP